MSTTDRSLQRVKFVKRCPSGWQGTPAETNAGSKDPSAVLFDIYILIKYVDKLQTGDHQVVDDQLKLRTKAEDIDA